MIRLATPHDGAAIAAIYRPSVVESATSFELEAPDAAEMATRVTSTMARTPWIVCTTSDDVTGYAYASRHRERAAYQWSVEVSAYVRQDVRRAGIASALYDTLFAILALQGFRNAFAGITLPNPASVAFHERLGFEPIGIFREIGYKQGRWHDVQWLGRELASHVVNPPPPRPLPDLVGSIELEVALRAGESRFRSMDAKSAGLTRSA
ncbi:MAG TPA: GNAT family N-acetyltransferase [Gemmatimonadaceae bacterium]|nr:GNAT family N-acetyltransferase [Gemmatimonadaceae bacterium]